MEDPRVSNLEEIVWKYNPDTQRDRAVQHAFKESSKKTAICGSTLQWFSPYPWASDEYGLSERRQCMRCLRVLS